MYKRQLLDSGAAENVIPTKCVPEKYVSRGSQFGKRYVSATGNAVQNRGELKVRVQQGGGQQGVITYQIADISKALTSVAKIADLGNKIVLDSNGGYIECKETGDRTEVHRKGNVYVLEMMACPF